MSQNVRRMEALPLSWNSLSDVQRMAIVFVSAWLVDAFDSISRTHCVPRDGRSGLELPSVPVLDRNRRSQLAFIDGDRGTGKSSVLLTLMDLTSADYFPGKLPASVQRLRDQRRRLVWLETLDMEPLSRGTNLFAAILARIAQVLDTNIGDIPPIAAALGDPDGYANAASKLQQLQN